MPLSLTQAATLAQDTAFRSRVVVGALRLAAWVMAQRADRLEDQGVTAVGARQAAQAIIGRPHDTAMQRRLALLVASYGPLVVDPPADDAEVDQSDVEDSRIEAALQALLPAMVNAGEVNRPAPPTPPPGG